MPPGSGAPGYCLWRVFVIWGESIGPLAPRSGPTSVGGGQRGPGLLAAVGALAPGPVLCPAGTGVAGKAFCGGQGLDVSYGRNRELWVLAQRRCPGTLTSKPITDGSLLRTGLYIHAHIKYTHTVTHVHYTHNIHSFP